jgi:hypothetical protein
MSLFSAVRTVAVLGFIAAVADDLSGAHAGAAIMAWARGGGPGEAVQHIEQRIGPSRIERISAATTAITALARDRSAQAASALLLKLSGEGAADRLAQTADQQIDAGQGLRIIVRPRPAAEPSSRRKPGNG